MVFVTGATGILGRVLVLELLKQGKTVRAAKRNSSNLEEMHQSFRFYTDQPTHFFQQIDWVDIDFQDIHSLQNALVGIHEVYHCAAKVSFDPRDEKKMFETNIEGTKNLLYACESSSVKKFCFVSSIAVLDGLNDDGEMDESSDFNSKLEHSAYAISKHFSEMEVWRAAAEGLYAVIINPGMIIGSGNWNESSGTIFKTFRDHSYSFSGGTSYVDVHDVAKIAVELMEKNVFGERFILISENRKYKEVADQVRKSFGKKQTRILPKAFLNLARLLNVIFGWLIPGLRMATKPNIEAVTGFNTISNKKIKEKLNYQFIPIDESMAFHLENYKKDLKERGRC